MLSCLVDHYDDDGGREQVDENGESICVVVARGKM
jgi:hypothetical protein